METSMILPFDEKDLLKNLPVERSETEISGEYKALFAECMKEYDLAMEVPRRARAVDLTVSLARGLKDGVLNVAKWVDTLIPEFDIMVSACSYATRALDNHASDNAPSLLSFEKPADNGFLRIDMEVAPSGADVKMRLLDAMDRPILPFSLTVADADSGEILLAGRRFSSGAASIKGMKKGRYDVVADGGICKCGFTMAVE
jgi:hypothetical protein